MAIGAYEAYITSLNMIVALKPTQTLSVWYTNQGGPGNTATITQMRTVAQTTYIGTLLSISQ